MKALGYTCAFCLAFVLSAAYAGFALSVLWGWFLVPSLHMPPINTGYAAGIALMAGYLTSHSTPAKSDKSFKDLFIEGVVFGVMKPTLALLVGWIITLFL